MSPRHSFVAELATAPFIALAICAMAVGSAAKQNRAAAKTLAQTLVEEARAKHSEVTEIGISARSTRGCRTIASTDPGDVGGKCEEGDSRPMRTGKPFAEKERDGFDISLPLHDASGKMIGAVAMEFKLTPGQTSRQVLGQAREIAGEIEKQIPSKASLHLRPR